jgi:hypothetical protein
MTSRAQLIFEAVKCASLLIIASLLLLILHHMPPTLAERQALEGLRGPTLQARAKELYLRTPIINVQGQVEADISNVAAIQVEVTNRSN